MTANQNAEHARLTKIGWLVFAGFGGVALFFLATEHTAHFFGALPFLLVAACPLMHLFHHHGHRHDGDHGHRDPADRPASPQDSSHDPR